MKVLIVKVGAMGDVLHTLPAVAALHHAKPEWTLNWVVDTRWIPLLINTNGNAPVVRRVHPADTKLWLRAPFSPTTLSSVLALRRALRAERYDLIVDLQGTLRSAVIGRMAGAPVLAGYADPRERLAAKLYTKKLQRFGIHVIDMGAALLSEATGVALTATDVELPHEAASEAWATGVTNARPLCVLAPGAGWGAKCWPAEKFGMLARQLQKRGYDVVVNASRENDPLDESVVAASGHAARVVVCDIAGLTALLRRASLVIGNDSGPTHLAAALGVPLVALFGPTDPARNGPRGMGACRVLRDNASATSYKRVHTPDPGLERMSVADVLAAALEVCRTP